MSCPRDRVRGIAEVEIGEGEKCSDRCGKGRVLDFGLLPKML